MGKSLLPLLHDSSQTLKREGIFWHFPAYLQGSGDPHGGPFRTTPAGAVRAGNWKLIQWFETDRMELYNLKEDIGEAHDLSQSHPEKLKELHTLLLNWQQEVNAPIPVEPNPLYKKRAEGKQAEKRKQSRGK